MRRRYSVEEMAWLGGVISAQGEFRISAKKDSLGRVTFLLASRKRPELIHQVAEVLKVAIQRPRARTPDTIGVRLSGDETLILWTSAVKYVTDERKKEFEELARKVDKHNQEVLKRRKYRAEVAARDNSAEARRKRAEARYNNEDPALQIVPDDYEENNA